MRKIIIVLCLALLPLCSWAQYHHLGVGLAGGGALYAAENPIQSRMGFQGQLQLDYLYYWRVNRSCELGIRTGLDAGYAQAGLKGKEERQFANLDYLGNTMRYTTHADYASAMQAVRLALPLMFAIRSDGFICNIGAKLMAPVWNQSKQQVRDIQIDAYYERYDVHVVNRLITGEAGDNELKTRSLLPLWNLLLGFEMGYEWELDRNQYFGVQLFLDASPWNSHRAQSTSILDVAAITDPVYPPAEVKINPISSTSKHMLSIDFGLRLFYAFECRNSSSTGLHRW